MKKVAIIGGGIFGSTVAIELLKTGNFLVTLFERDQTILNGASYKNLLRAHYGYHYPRSKETADKCIKSNATFINEFSECISIGFPSYYAVVSESSKTSAKEFLKFCDSLGLPYEIEWPSDEFLDKSKAVLCIKTYESVYDPDKLRNNLLNKLKLYSVDLRLNCEVIGGQLEGNLKKLKIKTPDNIYEESFDYVVNATYSNINDFCKWFDLPQKVFRYQLMEVLEIKLPVSEKIGIIMIDGNFSAFLPNGSKNTFRIANANESIIYRAISDYTNVKELESKNNKTNRDSILKRATEFFPIMSKAEVIRSFYITQVVKAFVENTDERPSEIFDHGNGMYSILAGKVVTCIDTAKEITESIINKENKRKD